MRFEIGDQYKILSYDSCVNKFGKPKAIYFLGETTIRIYEFSENLDSPIQLDNDIFEATLEIYEIKESQIRFRYLNIHYKPLSEDYKTVEEFIEYGILYKIDIVKAIQTLLNY